MSWKHSLLVVTMTLVIAPVALADTSPAASGMNWARLPLRFEANVGQTDDQVELFCRGSRSVLFATESGLVLKLGEPGTVEALKLELVGGSATRPTGEEPLSVRSSYFVGEPARWRSEVPSYARIRYRQPVPGVDLVVYGRDQQLEYDLYVAPGVDPGTIQLRLRGAHELALDGSGNLVLTTPLGREVVHQTPFAYQVLDGARQQVACVYSIDDGHLVRFELGPYDSSQPLVIDPVLTWATYLGAGDQDIGHDIAVDDAGNVYVVGWTLSEDFPLEGPIQSEVDSFDAFIAKINPDGDELIYSTLLGGSANDHALSIAVDQMGAAYVAGATYSTDFPTVSAVQAARGGNADAWVAKIDPTGSELVYSTYLGGTGKDWSHGVAVDSGGRVIVAGETASDGFPVASALQGARGGGIDGFVTRLTASGSLSYSTFVGGRSNDFATGVAVDPSGAAYVAGYSASDDFPTTTGAYQRDAQGGDDVFVAKLQASGSSFAYSTLIGTPSDDRAFAVAVDSQGRAVVTGQTYSSFYPTASPAQAERGGKWDAIVTRLSASGGALSYSTFFGGSEADQGNDVTVDSTDAIVITGSTESTDLAINNAHQEQLAGGFDAFVAAFDGESGQLGHASFIGGSSDDEGNGVATTTNGDILVIGTTESSDFPTAAALQEAPGDLPDAFIVKVHGRGTSEGYTQYVPAVIHAPGAGGSQWRCDIAAVNTSSSVASLVLTFVGDSTHTTSVSLPANGTESWPDVLVSAFGSSAADAGVLHVISDQPIVITSRTFNATAAGTYGQYLPALASADGIAAGARGYLPQLAKSASRRTNVGFMNLSGTFCEVRVKLWGANGQQLGTTVARTVGSYEWLQVNDVFGAAGAGETNAAYATVEPVTAGTRLWAYASVVDNDSGDPTTIPLLR